MKVAIIGAGGVGGVFGARLARGGYDVSFIARGAHLAAIARNGLRLKSELRGDVLLKPAKVTGDPKEIGPVDFVFLSVKLWDTESALAAVKPLLAGSTAVISLQNGIEKDQLLRKELGPASVAGGVSYVAAFIEEPGLIVQRGQSQKLVFGEYDGRAPERLLSLQRACLSCEIEADISDDIEKTIWEKFVFLVAMSSVLAATRQTIGSVRSNQLTRDLLVDVMQETIAVGRACGVELDHGLIARRLEYCDSLAPDVMASMLHDLQQGNRLELPWLGGAVVDLGVKHGIPTPVNRVLVALLSPYVAGTK